MVALVLLLLTILALLLLSRQFVARRRIAEILRSARTASGELQAKIHELESSRSQIEGILQSMEEGVLVVGPREEMWMMNASARTILEISAGTEKGTPLAEITRHPGLLDLVRRVFQTGRPEAAELQLFGTPERILLARAAVYRSVPEGWSAVLVLRDVTELKRLEQIRRDFVANVSHELKTPLAAIRGAAETLLDGALEDPKAGRSFLSSIQEEVERLRHLVDDLLTLALIESKPAEIRCEQILIGLFLQEQLGRYESMARTHGVSMKLQVQDSGKPLLGDPYQLAQAVGNLLDNAIKYNQPGGTVHVRAARDEHRLRLEVEDTGIGIPPQDLPRIFERFYRVDKARSRQTGGTGLGLSIVKHVAEAHGGSVAVQSHPGRGSCFMLILPLEN